MSYIRCLLSAEPEQEDTNSYKSVQLWRKNATRLSIYNYVFGLISQHILLHYCCKLIDS